MRQLRGFIKSSPKRISIQDEQDGKDKEKAGKAIWRSALQQVHETGNDQQSQAIEFVIFKAIIN